MAILSTYLIGSPIGSVLFNIQVAQSSEVPLVDIFASVVFYTFVIGLIALMSTFWVTFPLGALGGAIYERTQ
ncbi:MAG: hypothetical protein J07HN6_01234 [Halonotius sp. J07HN6]|nr:MAG: hypothetical protein J07HN6_01234 [Halonotius sp. J07HN6]ERH05110.1 MAG: hypothetical protein J07HN4v3_00702 [Halonotius sp. J07HN4]